MALSGLTSSGLFVAGSRLIAAPRQAIFDILADPAQHPLIDGSGSVKQLRADGPARLSMGAKFGMDMHMKRDYKVTNTVSEFDEPALIAWHHFNGHVWRYRLTEADGGTLVTEEWDARKAKNRMGLRLLRFGKRNQAGIVATLAKLDALVTDPHVF